MNQIEFFSKPNWGGNGTFNNRSHYLTQGTRPVISNMKKPDLHRMLLSIDANDDLTYSGEIPSIIGMIAMLVRVNHRETIVFTRPDIAEPVRAKYGVGFRRFLGIVTNDPYEKTKHLRHKFHTFSLNEELDVDDLASEIPGYDSKEEALIEKYHLQNHRDADSETDDEHQTSNIEVIKKGLKNLRRKELEVYALWTNDYTDSEIAKSLQIEYDTVLQYKSRIYKKLRDHYRSSSLRKFGRAVVALNRIAPLDDFIEELLTSSHSQDNYCSDDDTASILTAKEREVFHYWKILDSTGIMIPALRMDRARIDKTKRQIFEKIGHLYEATTADEFIRRVREKGGLKTEGFEILKRGTASEKYGRKNEADVETIIREIKFLSNRELEVFHLWGQGKSTQQIAAETSISHQNVKDYKSRIYKKMAEAYQADHREQFIKKLTFMHDQVNSRLREVSSASIDWNLWGQSLTDQEFTVLTLWRQGNGKFKIGKECGVDYRQIDKIQLSIVDKLKPFHGLASRREFEGLFECRVDTDTVDYLIETTAMEVSEQDLLQQPTETAPVEILENKPITFNDFITAYGNRKDVVKALDQFNKIPESERPAIMADILRSKAIVANFAYNKSPEAYLIAASWRS